MYDIREGYKIAYSYEDIANILYGKPAMVVNNICILFYLFSCQMSYMTLIKDTFPQIITDFGRLSNPEYSIEDKWYFQGEYCLLWIVLLILVPLGCAKRIDFLGFTSCIGMIAMTTFVFVVIAKQPDVSSQCGNISYPLNGTRFNHNIETECFVRPLNLSKDSIYAAGIVLFAYMSHCNVLAIFAEVRTRSLERMRGVVYGAILPCTGLYILSAMFAYNSFYNHTQAQLIELYSFIASDGNLILMSNCLVMTCIIFSIPLAQYPARNTIWKLIHTCIPQYFPDPFLPAELSIPEDKRRPFPWKAFYGIMLFSFGFIYFTVVSAANFKLFLALSGAVSGSTVIMIFPALFHLKMENWNYRTLENFCTYLILIAGFVTLFGNSGMIVMKEFGGH
jgi:sodium-coupled neutral amino acid transporter 4